MRKTQLYIPVLGLLLALLSLTQGCQPENPWGSGPIGLSADTVEFDTIFTTFASPSERLLFYNPTNGKLKIDAIYLEAGDQSDFSMIVDGVPGNMIEDYEILPGDSGIIFIDFVSNVTDAFARDRIFFEVNGEKQFAWVEAYVMDAYFFSAPKDSVLLLPCNTVWDNTKPIVIDGPVRVAPGCNLTITDGTQLHFTPRKDANFNLISMIDVWGTMNVTGSLGNEVVFQQTRMGRYYEETPAQWRGLRFWTTSSGSRIEHAILKNGLIGIEADSASLDFNPKLIIEKTEVRNMGGYGILGVGATPGIPAVPIIQANNCLIHNSSENNFLAFAGGLFEFNNCTFANYSIDFSRKTPQVGFTNYFEDTSSNVQAFYMEANFNNCIIWGTEEEEVGFDTVATSPSTSIVFDYCLLKTTLDLKGSNQKKNEDPQFEDPTVLEPYGRIYRLKDGSPAIDAGKDLSGIYSDDKENVLRDASFDLGCFEFVP